MKKSIIALAVAGALTAPIVAQADATLYGSLRLNLSNYDAGLDFTDNSSRIGIKGSTELFSGAKGIFQFEQAVSTETGNFTVGRLASLGVTGDFGTINAGRQWSPFAIWTIFPTDILVNSDASGSSGYKAGSQLGDDGTSFHRLPNTIAYLSPTMSGFTVAAVAVAGGDTEGTDNVDAYNLAVKYSVDGLTLAASTIGVENTVDESVNSFAASYKTGGLYVAARYQEDGTADAGSEDSYELAGSYTMGNTTFTANFIDDDKYAQEKYSLEVSQKLGKAAQAFVGYYEKGGAEDKDLGIKAGDKKDGSIAVGYRVDF